MASFSSCCVIAPLSSGLLTAFVMRVPYWQNSLSQRHQCMSHEVCHRSLRDVLAQRPTPEQSMWPRLAVSGVLPCHTAVTTLLS